MAVQFTPIRKIERAISFKVEYINYLDDSKIESREFKSLKSLSQWVERNDYGRFLELNRFALIDEVWEPYTIIGKTTVTLHTLKCIVKQLEDESFKTSKSKI